MKLSAWLLAMSLGATLVGSGAKAQLIPDGFSPPNGATRLLPIPRHQQSPAATACANEGGSLSAEARLAGCSSLIDSGKWKGRDIAWAFVNRCIVYKAQGQTEMALVNCDQAIKDDPQSWLAYQMRGEVFEKLDSPEKALADYDQAIEFGAKNVAIFVNGGDILLSLGQADKALAYFNRALELKDQSVLALIGRGGAWIAKGEADSAVADFSKAIEIAPDNAIAWFDRGAAWFGKGENDKAAEDFKQALKLNPTNAYAALWQFVARARAGALESAQAELQASSTKFSQTEWPFPVAQFYLGGKDAQEVLAAAKSPGDQCEAQFYLGEERLLKKARDEALLWLRKAVESCPKNFAEYLQAVSELKALDHSPVDAPPRTEAAPVKDESPKAVEAEQPLRPAVVPGAEETTKLPEAPKADEAKDPVAKP